MLSRHHRRGIAPGDHVTRQQQRLREMALNLRMVMHHRNHRAAFLVPGGDQAQQFGGGLAVDRIERFIQQNQIGILQQQTGEQHALELAGRQRTAGKLSADVMQHRMTPERDRQIIQPYHRKFAASAHHTPSQYVLNGRFKGGYITRQYGRPLNGVHAVQLEMSQEIYMKEEFPFPCVEELAAKLEPILKDLVQRGLEAATAL